MKIRLIHLSNSTVNTHDYYCHDSNYYSNEASLNYRTWEEFYAEFGKSDVDMNLCFRWDVKEIMVDDEDGDDTDVGTGRYYMKVYIMGQRKGKFIPIEIGSILEENVDQIIEYLTAHWDKLTRLWKPLSPEEDLSYLEEPYENANP